MSRERRPARVTGLTLEEAISTLGRVKAVVFDMDGVVTETARVHASAWKRTFDAYLRVRAQRDQSEFKPFDIEHDYNEYVDGKPRYDGVRSFLDSRGIQLRHGDTGDSADTETVCGIGNAKNAAFLEVLRRDGAKAYPSTVRLVRALQDRGTGCAVISASRNADDVLEAAGVSDLFGIRVAGAVAEQLGLPGKPAPDIFVEAAKRLGAEPDEAAIVEDALAGVEAGHRGHFALVIGVDRIGRGHAEELRRHGAHCVVSDLSELLPPRHSRRAIHAIGPVEWDSFKAILANREVALFLDYDGTLSPIVDDPDAAVISEGMRRAVARLAKQCLVAVVSGRDVRDVSRRMRLEGIFYYGSHGLDVITPQGERRSKAEAIKFLPALDQAEAKLRAALANVDGCIVERKRFSIAVHHRRVAQRNVRAVQEAFEDTAELEPRLRRSHGKKVFELRPRLDWDKGAAVRSLVKDAGAQVVVPIYLGDDETDEDAFSAVADDGVGIVVRGENDDFEVSARYALDDTKAVQAFLEELAEYLEIR